MDEKKKFSFLKFEGIVFALSIIFFIVMYYFEYMTIYMLSVMVLILLAVLFSINATIQADRSTERMAKANTFISVVLFLGSLGLSTYFYLEGLITLP